MSELSKAERTLWWAGLALAIGLLLVKEARGDLGKAKAQLRSERNARVDLEERVDQMGRNMDGALDEISRLKRELGDEGPPA
jgi:hypothetical protein